MPVRPIPRVVTKRKRMMRSWRKWRRSIAGLMTPTTDGAEGGQFASNTLGMFTDRTQIEQVTTFADEIESLQDEIRAAIAEKGRQSRYDSD